MQVKSQWTVQTNPLASLMHHAYFGWCELFITSRKKIITVVTVFNLHESQWTVQTNPLASLVHHAYFGWYELFIMILRRKMIITVVPFFNLHEWCPPLTFDPHPSQFCPLYMPYTLLQFPSCNLPSALSWNLSSWVELYVWYGYLKEPCEWNNVSPSLHSRQNHLLPRMWVSICPSSTCME